MNSSKRNELPEYLWSGQERKEEEEKQEKRQVGERGICSQRSQDVRVFIDGERSQKTIMPGHMLHVIKPRLGHILLRSIRRPRLKRS